MGVGIEQKAVLQICINVQSKSNLSGRGKAVIYTWFSTRFTSSEHQPAQPQADELPGVSVLRPAGE